MKCPICSSEMSLMKVAPCYDCGDYDGEIEEFENGEHEYHLFKAFEEEIVLCDFCDADFGSYHPEFLGLDEKKKWNGAYPLELLKRIDSPIVEEDYHCEACQHRLAFLNFLKRIRAYNQTHIQSELDNA